MSVEDQVFRLTGWIRLVPGEGFGISLFRSGNSLYFAETDSRLTITNFHAFYNEEGYKIEDGLPPGLRDRSYAVGDGGPIPFYEHGSFGIVDVEIGAAEILKAYGAQLDQGVVGTIARVVLEAEEGVFEKQKADREARDFERGFATVYSETPVHSRYWLEQYEAAIVALSDQREGSIIWTVPQQQLSFDTEEGVPITDGNVVAWERLKAIGLGWLRKFLSSSSPDLLFSFLAIEERNRIRATFEMQEIYYLVFTSLLAKSDYRNLLRQNLTKQIKAMMPDGIYYYELERHERIRSNPDTDFARHASVPVDMLRSMALLLDEGEKKRDFQLAISMSNLLFGRGNLPPDVHGRALRIGSRLAETIEKLKKSYRGRGVVGWQKKLLLTYRALITLRELLDWQNQRFKTARGLGLSPDAMLVIEQLLLEERAAALNKPPGQS